MKKVQTSKAEGLAMIDKWKSSGKSSREFCEEQNLTYHRLQYWHGVYNRVKISENQKGENKFIPISIQRGNVTSPGIEINTPGGYTIKLYNPVDLKSLLSILS